MALFIVAALGMGYATDKRFGSDAGILYILMVLIHFFLNYLLMHKKGFTTRKILYASAVIACVYLLVIFH